MIFYHSSAKTGMKKERSTDRSSVVVELVGYAEELVLIRNLWLEPEKLVAVANDHWESDTMIPWRRAYCAAS